jgi:hypothetical protein
MKKGGLTMLFAALFNYKPTASPAQTLPKRMGWKPPQGVKPIAEYWLGTNTPHVIVIFEADNIAPIMAIRMPWADDFDVTVVPAVTAEEGLKLAGQMMAKA